MPLRISCCHLCLSFSLAFDKFHYVFRLTYASNIIVTFYATPPIKPTHNWSTVYTHALSTFHVYYIYIYIYITTYQTPNDAYQNLYVVVAAAAAAAAAIFCCPTTTNGEYNNTFNCVPTTSHTPPAPTASDCPSCLSLKPLSPSPLLSIYLHHNLTRIIRSPRPRSLVSRSLTIL